MRTAFKILPQSTTINGLNLLIELGWSNFSILYYTSQPLQLHGLQVFHFDKHSRTNTVYDALQKFLNSETLPADANVDICYNFRECSLVPTAFYQPEIQKEMLDCLYMPDADAEVLASNLDSFNAHLIYRVPAKIRALLKERFPAAVSNHTQALVLPKLQSNGNILYCNVRQHTTRIVLFKDGQLQITNYYDFVTPTDVAYQLLNICTQFKVLPQDLVLSLSGFIDKNSNLYDELYKFFPELILETPEAVTLAAAIEQYPLHFFSHLTRLLQCAS